MDNSGTAASAKTHPQKGDFVKISYTGIEAATGHVFDTTSDVDAKQFGVFD